MKFKKNNFYLKGRGINTKIIGKKYTGIKDYFAYNSQRNIGMWQHETIDFYLHKRIWDTYFIGLNFYWNIFDFYVEKFYST